MASTNATLVKAGMVTLGAAAIGALTLMRSRKAAAQSKSGADAHSGWHRLPTNVKPIHYDLTLEPDMRTQDEGGSYTFKGSVNVTLDVASASSTIVLNAVDIQIHSAAFVQNGKESKAEIEYDAKNETVTFKFAQAVAKGLGDLRIEYTGQLNDKMKGFYRSFQTTPDGSKKLIATTQFEPTAARHALPCWDEPALKATFGVTLVVPKGLTAESNMPCIDQKDLGNGRFQRKFDKSPVMSTYLLAFIVGDFEKLETKIEGDILVRVFTPMGKKDQGKFALDVAAKCLPFYTKYFEIGYPLPKLDMFAIPDFSSGAMENWGIVTYRETALLYDPALSGIHNKQYVALVVAHELAHQWFGNLVTMEWWTDLWLNEGFATWIEFLAVDHIFPEWEIWMEFVHMDFTRAMSLDSLENSHPIEVEVKHPDEIDEIFDAISYSKGCCVIRMLASYLGEETFRRGLAVYLKQYKYKNAVTTDLWRVLAQTAGKPVEEIMGAWTRQTGYPVLHVSVKDDGTLTASQVRFLKGRKVQVSEDSTVWPVPLIIAAAPKGSAKAVESVTLLQGRSGDLPLPAKFSQADWVKVNYQLTCHVRVNYPPQLWAQLIQAIGSSDARLGEIDRLGVQDDAFALTAAGDMEITQLLEIVQAFKAERSATVVADLSVNLLSVANLLKQTPLFEPFCSWASSLFADMGSELGWDPKPDESHNANMLRTAVIPRLVGFGHPAARDEALKRFDAVLKTLAEDPNNVNKTLIADLRGSAYGYAVRERGEAGYEAVLNVYKTATSDEEKTRALRGLTSAQSPALLARALDFALSADVRSQNVFMVVCGVIDNRKGTQLGWEFIQSRWEELVKRFGGQFQLGRMISSLSAFASDEKADEIEKFFKSHPAPAAERTVQQTLEKIRAQAAWLKRDQAGIAKFLNAKGFSADSSKAGSNKVLAAFSKSPLKVAITGAAGQIAYSLIPLVASGQVFGADQPILLALMDIEPALPKLKGLVWEIEDSSFPLLAGIQVTSNAEEAFAGAHAVVLLGGFPRTATMTRGDLLNKNGPIFTEQGRALNKVADKNVKVLVVANPANTNCLIAASNAPDLPKSAFSALTRLDANRTQAQVALKLQASTGKTGLNPRQVIRKVILWGNHSKTMVPDISHAEVAAEGGKFKPLPAVINDEKWETEVFTPTVQDRGTRVIEMRGQGSALSAAQASADHMRTWFAGTAPNDWTSMAVWSDGSYGAPKDVFFSFPVTCSNGNWSIVRNLQVNAKVQAGLSATGKELVAEREDAKAYLR